MRLPAAVRLVVAATAATAARSCLVMAIAAVPRHGAGPAPASFALPGSGPI
jgi:hypothetical protein